MPPPLHMNNFCSPVNSPLVAPCLIGEIKWEAKSANPKNLPTKAIEKENSFII